MNLNSTYAKVQEHPRNDVSFPNPNVYKLTIIG